MNEPHESVGRTQYVAKLEAEVKSLRADNADLLARLDAAGFAVSEGLRDVAERQREAVKSAVYAALSLHPDAWTRSQLRAAVMEAIDATRLVTEGEP